MPSIYAAFPSKYVRAVDLGTRRTVVTISHVKHEDVGGDGETRPVVYFRGTEKGLVLNKTKAAAIVEIAGTEDPDAWAGVRIALQASTTTYKGQPVACLLVTAPQGPKPVPEPEPEAPLGDQDIGF